MATAEFDAARLEARAGEGWTTLTELADTLVRDHGVPFTSAHAIAGRLIGGRAARAEAAACRRCSRTRRPSCSARRLRIPRTRSREILSPRHFVNVRATLGGPAPEETAARGERVAPAARGRRGMVDARHGRARRGGAPLAERSAAL